MAGLLQLSLDLPSSRHSAIWATDFGTRNQAKQAYETQLVSFQNRDGIARHWRFAAICQSDRPNIVRLGDTSAPIGDLYHSLIRMSWPRFIAFIVLVFLLLNLIFAVLYTLDPSGPRLGVPYIRPTRGFARRGRAIAALAACGGVSGGYRNHLAPPNRFFAWSQLGP